MNSLKWTAASIAAGSAMAIGMNVALDAPLLNPTEMNARVERCAGALGQAATFSTMYPEKCEGFELYIDSIERKVAVTSSDGGRTDATEQSEFVLPSAEEFRREFGATATAKETYEDSRRVHKWMSRGVGSLFGLCMFLLTNVASGSENRKQASHYSRPASHRLI